MRKVCVILCGVVLLGAALSAYAEGLLDLAPRALLDMAPPAEEELLIRVYDTRAKQMVEMALETYVEGVVAAEMPITYECEALKAQAVAARTYTAARLAEYGGNGCRSHTGADVCTNSACCQAYARAAELTARWGQAAEENLAKLREAVAGTRGQLITYRGEPINAMYHAASGGHTEDVELVYAQALPYLRGVVSEEAPESPTEQSFTRREINRALGVEIAEGKLREELEILSVSESGRVTGLRAGSKTLSGTEARRLLGLRSALFTMTFSGDSVAFLTAGYGHGVGMSQTGANQMAKRGATYVEILTWYYTGTQVG